MGRFLRRDPLAVLAIAASLAWMGCQPAVQPPAGNQKSPPLAQEKAGRKVVRSKFTLGDDWFRTRLLVVEAVQKDLGLTADQIGKIRDCAKFCFQQGREFRAKSREILPPSLPAAESDAREREFRALAEDFQRKGKEMRTKLLAMLTPSQSERLKQIQLQTAIPTTLGRPEIIKALDISEEQSRKIRALRDRLGKELFPKFPDLRGLDPKELRQKVIEFMKKQDQAQAEENKAVLEVLTAEQRAKLEKLLGKKIEVTMPYDAVTPTDDEFWTQ
jgi:Spy/CpxP family protein refolding chaperone